MTNNDIFLDMRSLSELSSEMDVNTNSSSGMLNELHNTIDKKNSLSCLAPFQMTVVRSLNMQPNSEHLQIIEQPSQSSKLRYRADYIREKTRLGVLKNRNQKSTYHGPAIRVRSFSYIDLLKRFFD
jgi:hypothetical protein